MPEPVETKEAMRKRLLAARGKLSPGDVEAARAAIREQILHVATQQQWRIVAAYEPLRTEPGSTELLVALESLGVEVRVPITLADRDLDWLRWPDGDALGVEAITHADAVFVPALAITPQGVRLGRGGGSYDRALARLATPIPIVALLYDAEIVPQIPNETWDIPVTAAVTPSGWRSL